MSMTMKPKTLRVLVVDDNSDQAMSLSMLLETSGYDSHVCLDARDCTATVEDLRPDVVLLDLGMPGKTGYEIAEEIKRRDDLRHIHLLAITGHGLPLDRLQTQMRGFDQHLLKPVDIEELQSILKSFQDH
jgi:two-component system OmpR family response regulator